MEGNTRQIIWLQWHPAFYAGIKVELDWERRQLLFENEHQLGTKPKEIDVLIIKKDPKIPIKKNIGQIFRTHNIVEYKSPGDYLSIDDYYKVYAYACFYKSDTRTEDEIKVNEITISFVCQNYPHSFVEHVQTEQGLKVEKYEDGIYYITGDSFAMQIIVTSELSKEKNFWLKNLTNDITDPDTVREIIAEFRKHEEDKLYWSLMDMIVRANREMFKEEKDMMCDALRELFQEEIDTAVQEATQQVTQQVTQQEFSKSIKKLIKNLQLTAEQAMDVLEIPLEERRLYV